MQYAVQQPQNNATHKDKGERQAQVLGAASTEDLHDLWNERECCTGSAKEPQDSSDVQFYTSLDSRDLRQPLQLHGADDPFNPNQERRFSKRYLL